MCNDREVQIEHSVKYTIYKKMSKQRFRIKMLATFKNQQNKTFEAYFFIEL